MDIVNRFYITDKYVVADIINKIPISEVLEMYYNVTTKGLYNRSIPCPIHGGKNKNFTIYQKTNTCHCFSKCCKTYNVISLGYEHYNTKDFNYVSIKMAMDFNIDIREYIQVKGEENV